MSQGRQKTTGTGGRLGSVSARQVTPHEGCLVHALDPLVLSQAKRITYLASVPFEAIPSSLIQRHQCRMTPNGIQVDGSDLMTHAHEQLGISLYESGTQHMLLLPRDKRLDLKSTAYGTCCASTRASTNKTACIMMASSSDSSLSESNNPHTSTSMENDACDYIQAQKTMAIAKAAEGSPRNTAAEGSLQHNASTGNTLNAQQHDGITNDSGPDDQHRCETSQ